MHQWQLMLGGRHELEDKLPDIGCQSSNEIRIAAHEQNHDNKSNMNICWTAQPLKDKQRNV
eukprot:1592465-Pleurochrysis_carterae.AAC.1